MKLILKRQVVIKNCAQDFGLGPGVVSKDEAHFDLPDSLSEYDKRQLFFQIQESSFEMMMEVVTVETEESRSSDVTFDAIFPDEKIKL